MIAHRLSTIQDADLILVTKQGELVESGTHDALVKQGGEYAKMWSTGMILASLLLFMNSCEKDYLNAEEISYSLTVSDTVYLNANRPRFQIRHYGRLQ